ncbi:hypothetical protein EOL96_06050 [Candidatus Saccharibacteria bacterium]|nr:hypothetical protein [Candidatus Saccharibacteria bacterium]
MVTKKNTQNKTKHISHTKTHIMLRKSLATYATIVFIAFILVSLSAFTIVETNRIRENYDRETRVSDIYNSLDLDSSYRVASVDIYGDAITSEVEYGHNADRAETFAELKEQIELAGFKPADSPDYGPLSREDRYVNDRGDTIRVSVDTKAVHAATLYGINFPDAASDAALEDGPVYVTIKVDLADKK